jgi:hypothetical protein
MPVSSAVSSRAPRRARRHPRPTWASVSALAFAAVLAAAAVPVRAQSDSAWNLSGFGTLGTVGQEGGHDWGFARNSTQRGASSHASVTPDSRLGLQLNWDGGPQWEGGIQGVLLRKPAGTPVAESIEWGYLGYRPWPNTRVRLGRTSPDIFLFADSRNVGFALPWARPPVDFYGFAPLASIDGVDLDQRWLMADSTWRARLTAGFVRTGVTDVDGGRVPLRGRDSLALGLSMEQGGLLLKASYLRSRIQLTPGTGFSQLVQGLNDLAAVPVPGLAGTVDTLGQNLWSGGPASYLALAAQYETGPWTFIAEGSDLRVPRSPLSARRAYVSVGYRIGPVTYYGLASRAKPRHAAFVEPDLATPLAPLGPEAAQEAQVLAGYAAAAGNNYRFDQSTVGVGLRWDFASTAALKLQLDRFDVRRDGGAGWRFSDSRPARGTVFTVLVDFVWGQ